jgi:hypothetical protein
MAKFAERAVHAFGRLALGLVDSVAEHTPRHRRCEDLWSEKVYAVDYPTRCTNEKGRMGVGREPEHERKYEWADQGLAR